LRKHEPAVPVNRTIPEDFSIALAGGDISFAAT
jgi:hypothetical protein